MTNQLNYFKNYIKKIVFPKSQYLSSNDQTNEFESEVFKHNNILIGILAYFLFFEQLYYGFFVREAGSLHQEVHIITAFLVLVYALISTYLYFSSTKKINFSHKSFVISFGVMGFIIAITRTMLFQNSIFTLPTIYLAVNYGLAVIIYLKPTISLIIYSSAVFSSIYLFSVFHSEQIVYPYISDVISNAIVAWIVSAINYHRYLKNFSNKLKISEMNQELKKLSSRDALTELYNRRKLDDFLQQELDRTKRYQLEFSVIIIDIDNFKEVNDNYGHNVGDQILVKFSQLLAANIRDADKLGRWGGEEFLIIAPETELESAFQLAEKLRKIIAEYNFDQIESLTASFGAAEYNNDQSIYQLINRADMALYKAKENGKNNVCLPGAAAIYGND